MEKNNNADTEMENYELYLRLLQGWYTWLHHIRPVMCKVVLSERFS